LRASAGRRANRSGGTHAAMIRGAYFRAAIPAIALRNPMPSARRRTALPPLALAAAPSALHALFVSVACATAAVDLATKQWAIATLGDRFVALAPRLSLAVMFNTASAGGVSLGAHTWVINVLATLLAIALTAAIVRPLAHVDRAAPLTLGLIAGGGIGNVASMLMDRAGGVPDFLGVHYDGGAIFVNVADVALLAGVLLLARSGARLVGAVRRRPA
jgi:signal peptidase II